MAKFVVDTSVWIDFFRGNLGPHVLSHLNEGIRLRVAAITDIIRHEILIGAADRQQYQVLHRLLTPLECLRVVESDLEDFDSFAWDLKSKGFKGKYTDVSIAYLCVRNKIPLLTLDGFFHQLARRGILQTIRV